MQVLRWSTLSKAHADSMVKNAAGTIQHAKKSVTITLPDASYEEAAMAVLAGLYQVEPWSTLFAGLTPQQQVQAAVLADMWQLTAACDAAVEVLETAAIKLDNAASLFGQLLSMPTVPDCLTHLFEPALLSKYGDLETLWAPDGASLQQSLMALPLHAMELLLASDKLEVRTNVDSLSTLSVVSLRQEY
jgi:hypothetical protein